MDVWYSDLVRSVSDVTSPEEIFAQLKRAAALLGFDYCAYGFRSPIPFTRPKYWTISDYPPAWKSQYDSAGYIFKDPTVIHAQMCEQPIIWDDRLYAQAPSFWEEARAHGLVVGWAKSTLDGGGGGGLLTLARTGQPLTESELEEKELRMRQLADVAHGALGSLFRARNQLSANEKLSAREIEVLRWHADGKTAAVIADILNISHDTVKFHTKNAVTKLGAANKTAAVVRAAVLGLLA